MKSIASGVALNKSAAPALRSSRRENGWFSKSVSLWTARIAESVEMPRVKGLKNSDDLLLGVVLSHPHLDHYGTGVDGNLAFHTLPYGYGGGADVWMTSAIFTSSTGERLRT